MGDLLSKLDDDAKIPQGCKPFRSSAMTFVAIGDERRHGRSGDLFHSFSSFVVVWLVRSTLTQWGIYLSSNSERMRISVKWEYSSSQIMFSARYHRCAEFL